MSLTEPVKRKGNPAWVKGMATPFRGSKSGTKGIQDPGPRAKLLVERHGIASILKAIEDKDYLAETFSTYDGMLIVGIGNSLRGNGEERERMLNRMFGKVADKQINLNVNIDASPEQLSDNALGLLDDMADSDQDDSESDDEYDLIEQP